MKKTLLLMIIIQMISQSYAQWNHIYQDSTLFEVHDLYFFNQDTGLVCGTIQASEGFKGFIMRTYDGGETWQNTISDIMICYAIDFINTNIGYSGGQDGALYKTMDGGVTWDYLSSILSFSDFEDLEFINDSVGFVKTYHGPVSKTTDGGITWSNVSDVIYSEFYDRKYNSLHFISDSIGFVVGNGKIYKTNDQGSNWQKQNADSTKWYKAMCMIDESEGFAVGNDGVLIHTIDGGENWTTDSICDQDLRDIDFITENMGYIVGGGHGYDDDTVGVVLRTEDKGLSWETLSISDNRLNSFQYINSVAYITGNYGNIFKNDNHSYLLEFRDIKNVKEKLLVWPNPAESEIHINIPTQEIMDIELFDINGNSILHHKSYYEKKLDISLIPSGIYILIIKTDNEFGVEKLIVF